MAAYRRVYGFGHLGLTDEDRDQFRNSIRSFRVCDYLYTIHHSGLNPQSLQWNDANSFTVITTTRKNTVQVAV